MNRIARIFMIFSIPLIIGNVLICIKDPLIILIVNDFIFFEIFVYIFLNMLNKKYPWWLILLKTYCMIHC